MKTDYTGTGLIITGIVLYGILALIDPGITFNTNYTIGFLIIVFGIETITYCVEYIFNENGTEN